MGLQKNAKVDAILIPLDKLELFPDNPNEEDAITFNNLIEEIEQDGFDQPLVVIPAENLLGPTKAGKYVVVSGNHRLEALKSSGHNAVDCVVRDWDAEKAKIKVVRRNMLSGEINPKKFTQLVNSLMDNYTPDQIADAMGFKSIDQFQKLYKDELNKQDKEGKDATKSKEVNLIEGLSIILNRLFAEYGDTVPYNFMFFLVGSKVHLVVQANTKLKRVLELITKKCVEDHLDINLVLTGLLGVGINATQFEQGPPARDAIEQAALEGQNEDHNLKAVTKFDK